MYLLEENGVYLQSMEGLKTHCEDVGLEFISSPFSIASFELLESIGVKTYKIASGCVGNSLLLDRIIETGKGCYHFNRVISSPYTKSILSAYPNNLNNISFLHCITAYPAPIKKLNLLQIKKLKQEFPKIQLGIAIILERLGHR